MSENPEDLSEPIPEVAGFSPRILVVDDDEAIRTGLELLLREQGFEVVLARDGVEGLDLFQAQPPTTVITDVRMPRMSGDDLCQKILQLDSHMPVIFLTGYGNIPNAVESMRNGAFDYVTKPFNDKDLLGRIQRALERRRLDEQMIQLRRMVQARRFSDHLIGTSEAMQRILAQIHTIAKNDITVLLTGESGTGKELVARTVHMVSSRSKEKFVTVNCGAIPESLMESELFGHVKGSFTGAIADKVGLFEEADKGTIFLDEIGDMPAALQVKLLRILQEGEVRRVGDAKTRKVDVRVITATNKDLKKEVDNRNFREDLFYRINVFPIHISPLRDRREDIPLLVSFFVELYNKEMRLNIQGFSPAAVKKMLQYRWPGNVRELQNKVKQAMICTRRKVVGSEDVLLQVPIATEETLSFKDAKRKFEREYLVQVLKMTAGNITEAARIAQKDRKDFYDVMKKHRIEPEDFRA